jgi:hypothetical protein
MVKSLRGVSSSAHSTRSVIVEVNLSNRVCVEVTATTMIQPQTNKHLLSSLSYHIHSGG